MTTDVVSDPLQAKIEELRTFIQNSSAMVSRAALTGLLGKQYGGDRDLYQVLGYPLTISFEMYYALYERDGLGSRAVDGLSEECWRKKPVLWDGSVEGALDESADFGKQTEFLNAWRVLAEELNIFQTCLEVDKMLGYSRYAVIYIGAPGEANTPLKSGKIEYLLALDEGEALVNEKDNDQKSKRYGQPKSYTITLGDEGVSTQTLTVDWTRIIHVREGRERKSRIYGVPRLRPVYNYMMDMQKVLGSSSEAFWLLIRKGLAIIARDGVDLPVQGTPEYEALQAEIDEYQHQLRRIMRLRGMDIQDLGSDVVTADGQFNVVLSAIAGTLKVPQRILVGSERAQLASQQDDKNFSDVCASRQENFCYPFILKPLVQRLIDTGNLPKPTSGEFKAKWPSLFELTPLEKVQLANTASLTLRNLTDGDPELVMTMDDFMRTYFDYVMPEKAKKEAQAKVEAARKLDEQQNGPQSELDRIDKGVAVKGNAEDEDGDAGDAFFLQREIRRIESETAAEGQ